MMSNQQEKASIVGASIIIGKTNVSQSGSLNITPDITTSGPFSSVKGATVKIDENEIHGKVNIGGAINVNVQPKVSQHSMEENPIDHRTSYKLNKGKEKHGKVLIINMETFWHNPSLKREGSQKDVKDLKNTFKWLKFDVETEKNLTAEGIRQTVAEFARQMTSEEECVAVIIMSHGDTDYFLGSDEEPVRPQEIFEKFNHKNCPQLIGKPKLFIFNYCRGETMDSGVKLPDSQVSIPGASTKNIFETVINLLEESIPDLAKLCNRGLSEEVILTDGATQQSIPTWGDMIAVYASIWGYTSYRNPSEGSFLPQCLCETLNENAKTKDFFDILSITAAKINERTAFIDGKRFKPALQIGLTGTFKRLYFDPRTPKNIK